MYYFTIFSVLVSILCLSNASPDIDYTTGQHQQVLNEHLTPLHLDTLNSGQSANVLLAPTDLKFVLARTTEINNIELYDKCESHGKLNVVTISRDELFFINMSCMNYYMGNPLARETLGVTLGDRPGVLSPTVNFTITNVVKDGFHYEIHEGIVADGDLINATVTKVKTFAEKDFQMGCAQEPGLQFIQLLRADISIKAPYDDYLIHCQSTKRPGMNFYRPGIVAPEVLAAQQYKH